MYLMFWVFLFCPVICGCCAAATATPPRKRRPRGPVLSPAPAAPAAEAEAVAADAEDVDLELGLGVAVSEEAELLGGVRVHPDSLGGTGNDFSAREKAFLLLMFDRLKHAWRRDACDGYRYNRWYRYRPRDIYQEFASITGFSATNISTYRSERDSQPYPGYVFPSRRRDEKPLRDAALEVVLPEISESSVQFEKSSKFRSDPTECIASKL